MPPFALQCIALYFLVAYCIGVPCTSTGTFLEPENVTFSTWFLKIRFYFSRSSTSKSFLRFSIFTAFPKTPFTREKSVLWWDGSLKAGIGKSVGDFRFEFLPPCYHYDCLLGDGWVLVVILSPTWGSGKVRWVVLWQILLYNLVQSSRLLHLYVQGVLGVCASPTLPLGGGCLSLLGLSTRYLPLIWGV